MLVTCANELKIWEIENFNLANEYAFSKSINWLSIKSDNNTISTVVNNDSINLINLETQTINTYDKIEAKCCCFDSFGRLLAVGNLNGSLDLYDFKTNMINLKKRNYKIHNGAINCMSWSKNDRFLATGNNSGSIILFNSMSNQISKPLNIQNKMCEITCISHSMNESQHLASSYFDGSDILWDTNKEKYTKPIVQFKQHMQPSTCILLSPLNNVFMLSGGLDSLLICYDVLAKKRIKSILVAGGITTLDMHKDGSTVAVGTINGNVQMYDLRSNTDEPFYSYAAHDTALTTLKFLYSTMKNSSSKSISIKNTNLDKTIKQNDIIPLVLPYDGTVTPSNLTIRNSTSVVDNLNIEINSQCAFLTKSNSALNMNNSNFKININDDNKTQSLTPCNIYSPEIKKNESTQNTNSPINAFVLHKNQINVTPITNYQQTDNSINNSKYLSQNIRSKSQVTSEVANLYEKVDLFSPITINNQTQLSKTGNTTNQDYLKNDLKNALKSIQPSQSDTKCEENKYIETLKQYTGDVTPLVENNKIISCKHKSNSLTVGNVANDQINATIDPQTTLLPIEQIKEVIKDSIEDFKDELMAENFRFKAEILKEFIILKQELRKALQSCSLNDALIDEITKLREENRRLKKLF